MWVWLSMTYGSFICFEFDLSQRRKLGNGDIARRVISRYLFTRRKRKIIPSGYHAVNSYGLFTNSEHVKLVNAHPVQL